MDALSVFRECSAQRALIVPQWPPALFVIEVGLLSLNDKGHPWSDRCSVYARKQELNEGPERECQCEIICVFKKYRYIPKADIQGSHDLPTTQGSRHAQ